MIRYEEFKSYLKEQELSENTINSYLYELKKYEKNCGDDFSKNTIVDFKWKLTEKMTTKTVNHYITAIKKYCKFIDVECDVKKIKEQKISSVENVISIDQFNHLINSLRNDGKEKEAVWLIIPAKTGARINEFLRFTKQDFDNGYAKLYTKGKVRTIIFPKKMRDELINFFKDFKPDDFLIQNKFGKRMTSRGYDQMFKRYAKKYGIPKEVAHAHGLRHMFAKEFLKRNPNISLLADILGHSGVNTTMIYTRDSAEEQQKKIDNTMDW